MIKFLIIFFLVIYALGYLGRFLISRFLKKAAAQQAPYNNQYSQKEEGEVTVETDKGSQKHFTGSDGEYVDFEEVK